MTAIDFQTIVERSGLSLAALDGDQKPVLEDEEHIVSTFLNTSMTLGAQQDLGPGNLFTTGRRVVWVNQEKQGVSIPFVVISMHAVSRDPTLSIKPCIYCQLDQPEHLASHEGDEPLDVYELKLIPFIAEQVDAVFQALCVGAEANPDDVDEDEGDFFYDESEVQAGLDDESQARLAAFEDRLQLPTAVEFDQLIAGDPERFEDADEDDGPP